MRSLPILLCLISATFASAQDESGAVTRKANKAAAEVAYRQNVKTHGASADMLVLPGLLADRKARRVIVWAEATGIEAGATAEFFLIGETSGHGYEALAVSFAKPGDVQKALEFLGLKPGRPVDYTRFQFWPKGERVFMFIQPHGATGTNDLVRVEEMMLDSHTGKSMPRTGLVFTGSPLVPAEAGTHALVHAADKVEPNSVASNYNEPQTVLDVPRKAPQNDVYNTLTVNPATALPAGAPIRVIFEPEAEDGCRRVLDVTLEAAVKAETSGERLEDLAFTLSTPNADADNPAWTRVGATALVEALRQQVEAGRDPFVSLRLAKDMSLKAVTDLCQLLKALEGEQGIRVEPPNLPGIYYQAFTSNEDFRKRAKRPGEAWELHIRRKEGDADGRLAAKLVQIRLNWDDATGELRADATDIPLAGANDLPNALATHGPGLPVILVFADASATYGDLLSFLTDQVLGTHGTVHVYIGDVTE